jgi:HlyD family secretion protein
MDKQIKKKTWTVKRIATYGGIALFVAFIGYQFILLARQVNEFLSTVPAELF